MSAQGKSEGIRRNGTLSLARKWKMDRILQKQETETRKLPSTWLIFPNFFFGGFVLFSSLSWCYQFLAFRLRSRVASLSQC